MKTLYPEQTEARIIANTNLNHGIHSVFVSPCGTGKTVTACGVTTDRISLESKLRKGKKKIVYILVPQVEIMNQWIEELVEWGIDPGYCNDEGFRGKDRSVYVCMYQSLIGKLNLIDESLWPDEIIIDETQHMLCSSIMSICTFFGKAIRLGLTATLYHNSKQSFLPWYSEYFQTITKQQSYKKGYTTEPILIEPEDYLKDFDIPVIGNDYDMAFQASLLGETKIYGDMIGDHERLFFGRPVIVPCGTYEQAEQITKIFNDAGWNFEHLHSDGMPKHERERILSGVSDQTIAGVCTVGIGVEGLSIKGLWGVLWVCRTMSPIKWTQFNGRGERVYFGKEFCLIVDYVGNAIIHGHPADERKYNLEGVEVEDDEEGRTAWQVCWSCGTYNNPDNTECHWCAAEIGEGSEPEEGTCRKCRHFDKKEKKCDVLVLAGIPDGTSPIYHTPCYHVWLKFPGCQNFTKRSRKLPAIIDGKLVAITTDGQMTDIQDRADKIKQDQKDRIMAEDLEKHTAEKIDSFEKRKILQKGLFADLGKKSLFREALGG